MTRSAPRSAPTPPAGLVPLSLARAYVDLMGRVDSRAVTAVLLAYRPDDAAPCGVAVVRKASK